MIVNIKKGYEDIDVELNNVLDVLMPASLPSGLDEEALVKELESTLKEVVRVAEEAYTEALMREKAKRSKKVA